MPTEPPFEPVFTPAAPGEPPPRSVPVSVQPELITAATPQPKAPVPPPPPPVQVLCARVPLQPYTLYLFAARHDHAENFATTCLDAAQPWTFIDSAGSLAGLEDFNVFMFSNAATHPDAAAIEAALISRGAHVVVHPDLIPRLPVPPEPSTPAAASGSPGRLAVSAASSVAATDAATVVLNPMDIPPQA